MDDLIAALVGIVVGFMVMYFVVMAPIHRLNREIRETAAEINKMLRDPRETDKDD